MRRIARQQTRIISNEVETIPAFGWPMIPATLVFQRYLVALVGSFSGSELSSETVAEYFSVIGDSQRGNPELRAALAQAPRALPGPLIGRSNEFAATQTYTIGRSAEAYFFDDEVILPKEFREELK
jgi:hypothetical protein